MLDLRFNALFALIEREHPEFQSAIEDDEYLALSARYTTGDLCAFVDCMGMAVITVAHSEYRHLSKSYLISKLNRAHVRENFEDRLRSCVATPELRYSERDKELVAEYFRINPPPAPPPKLTIVTSDT